MYHYGFLAQNSAFIFFLECRQTNESGSTFLPKKLPMFPQRHGQCLNVISTVRPWSDNLEGTACSAHAKLKR